MFQCSFDAHGTYESEPFVRFTTKEASSTTLVVMVSVTGGVLVIVFLIGAVVHRHKSKGDNE